jgi:hypothetical protein
MIMSTWIVIVCLQTHKFKVASIQLTVLFKNHKLIVC